MSLRWIAAIAILRGPPTIAPFFATLTILIASVLGQALVPSPGCAQKGSESGEILTPELRRRVERGIALLEDRRFAEAHAILLEAFRESPIAPIAFNLAVASRGTGDAMAASALYGALLNGQYGELDSERRSQIEELLEATRAELSTVIVEATGASRARIHIDNEDRGTHDTSRPINLSVNAGEHDITASAANAATTRRTFAVGPGQSVRMILELTPIMATTERTAVTERGAEPRSPRKNISAIPTEDEPAPDSGFTTALFIAAGALLAGVIATGLWLGLRDGDPEAPAEDPVWGIGVTLGGARSW